MSRTARDRAAAWVLTGPLGRVAAFAATSARRVGCGWAATKLRGS